MATPIYLVYMNTMIFAIVSGAVSFILLLALIYVPAVTNYAILILTVQVALVAIVIAALIRIWWFGKSQENSVNLSNQNALAVGFCPDYMVASATDAGVGGGTTCTNAYAGTSTPIWTGSLKSSDPRAPDTVQLSKLDGKAIGSVCKAANDQTQPPISGLLTASTASVPWTELRSRCTNFS